MRRIFLPLVSSFILLLLMIQSGRTGPIMATNAISPGSVRADATFDHIGVLWQMIGDDDLDSSMSLEFRPLGGTIWRPGAMAMRAYPTIRVQDGPLGLNYWGASALFLEPVTAYELRLTLNDPDGGGQVKIVTAATRSMSQPDGNGRRLHTVPGNGGGDGSSGNPFRGLQAAADSAQPGDNIQVAPGIYAPFQLLASGTEGHPIVFSGPGDGSAIVDGNNTDRGVVTLGEYNRTLGHVIVQGLTIQNGRWGIDAQHTHDLNIHHNVIQDVDFGIYNRRDGAQEFNQTVCDNMITGRTPWPGSGIPGERGIDLRGTGNVVCHNTVRYFGDCISLQPFTGPSYGNDVFGNDAAYCVDDGIEIDYNQANARVWRNRVTNARMGVSVQPIRGGPAYIFRNEFFNLESVPIKMHNYTTGFIVAHNTGAKHGDGHGDNGAMWRNAIFRNNLFLGTRYAFEFTTVPDESFRDFDYNAWGTTRDIGGSSAPFFKWNNVRYDHIDDLPTGVENHGLEIGFGDLKNAVLPSDWNISAEPGSRDLRLQNGAPAVDAGTLLDNLNDPFPLSGPPDMGAFELGQPLPIYGPRPLMPDLSGSKKTASQPRPEFGEIVLYTLTLRNSGAPLTSTIVLTDTIPAGLDYVPGSLAATLGIPDDSQAPTLHWSGVLGDKDAVTIAYAVTVTESDPLMIMNTAVFRSGSHVAMPSATIIVNAQGVYLPVAFRG